MENRVWKMIQKIIFIVRIILLIGLFAFFLTPLFKQPLVTLNNASLQRARSERIAKDAMILQYRPASEWPQAISELQDTLPLWQQEQTSLAGFPDSQVQLLVLQSNGDYTAMTQATQNILDNSGKSMDPIQTSIIIAHEHNYEVTINQAYTLIQQDIAIQDVQFIGIELIIVILSIALTVFSRPKKSKIIV